MTVRTRSRGVAQIETGVRLQSEKLAASKLRIAEFDSPSQDLRAHAAPVPDRFTLSASLRPHDENSGPRQARSNAGRLEHLGHSCHLCCQR